ncbi:hypothetical protein [Ideonella sp. A 288]|uniref:hypothetical protein n=1 Tax=Ideonella sp. A 288 TaxID=1962181 RepID=UPI000B4B139D|nr:hypothetical protein [Ideonella sp. A 288]
MDIHLPVGWTLVTIVDALLVFTALEIAALWAWHRVTGRGIALREVWATLLAGAMLMLALRCALTPGWTLPTLACLATAGLGHAIDLRSRRRASATQGRASDAPGGA